MGTWLAWRRLVALAGAVSMLTTCAVSVAAADDNLAEFHQQKPVWAPCAAEGSLAGLDCAEIIVPVDYRRPTERIAVTMSRLKSATPTRGVLFVNPGGPGGSGLSTPLLFRNRPLAGAFDIIGFDPRGVGRSTALLCERTNYIGKYSSRPSDADFEGWAKDAQADEQGCQRAAGGLRPFVNTANTARDMDIMRAVLGVERINYLGFSYGTYLGAVYGSLFGARLNRSVLDSSVHPDWLWRKQAMARTWAIMTNVEAWFEWIGDRNKVYSLGDGSWEVRESVERIAERLHRSPQDMLNRSQFDYAIGQNARYRAAWDIGAKWLADLAEDKPPAESADAMGAARAFAELTFNDLRNGVFDTVTCEAEWPRDLKDYFEDMRGFRDGIPYGEGVYNAAPTTCAFRTFTPPEPPVELKRADYPTGLIVQAGGDPQTHYAGGPAMASRLRAHLITVPDDGAHGLYLTNTCVRRVVERYLLDSILPATRLECPGDPRPRVADDLEEAFTSQAAEDVSLERAAKDFLSARLLDVPGRP